MCPYTYVLGNFNGKVVALNIEALESFVVVAVGHKVVPTAAEVEC